MPPRNGPSSRSADDEVPLVACYDTSEMLRWCDQLAVVAEKFKFPCVKSGMSTTAETKFSTTIPLINLVPDKSRLLSLLP